MSSSMVRLHLLKSHATRLACILPVNCRSWLGNEYTQRLFLSEGQFSFLRSR